MKTLVTGGTGFIGSHLVKALVQQGREVVVASDFKGHGLENLLYLGVNPLDVTLYCVDLTDFSQVLRVMEEVDTVFHLAARVGNLNYLHASENIELITLQENLLIDTNTIKASLQKGVGKFIYASSCAVYPVDKQLTSGAVFQETDVDIQGLNFMELPDTSSGSPLIPDGGYGWSKLIGEIQLSWVRTMNTGIARIFNVYGENEPLGEKAHVVADLVRKAIQYPETEFIVFGDGKQTRDFLYVSDCADALLAIEKAISNPAGSADTPVSPAFNLGADVPVSIGNLAETIVKISDKDIKINYDLSKPVGPRSRTADTGKAKEILNWEPKVSLEEGLRRVYRWEEAELLRRR